jgi:phosphoribosylcarboxyaminoimidazole (NCAIR) mutase
MGAANAAHLAAEMLALGDAELRRKLRERRQRMAAEVLAKSKGLPERLRETPKSR